MTLIREIHEIKDTLVRIEQAMNIDGKGRKRQRELNKVMVSLIGGDEDGERGISRVQEERVREEGEGE